MILPPTSGALGAHVSDNCSRGIGSRMRRIWNLQDYHDSCTGCPEGCISKVYGTQFEIFDVNYGAAYSSLDCRLNLDVELTAVCEDCSQDYSAEIILDAVEQNYPWKNWHIIYSTLGGTLV